MSRHSLGEPSRPAAPALPAMVARRNALALAVASAGAGAGLGFFDPGAAATFVFLRSTGIPLPLWGGLFGLAAVLLLFRLHEAGHAFAAVGWIMLAAGGVVGLATRATTSPAGSILLTSLTLTVAGLHVNGMGFRRATRLAAARVRRGGQERGAS